MMRPALQSDQEAGRTPIPNDGGQAFPVTYAHAHLGMTIRDWFAGQIAASLAQYTFEAAYKEGGTPADAAAVLAETAYNTADAMLRARGPVDPFNLLHPNKPGASPPVMKG